MGESRVSWVRRQQEMQQAALVRIAAVVPPPRLHAVLAEAERRTDVLRKHWTESGAGGVGTTPENVVLEAMYAECARGAW